jgi:hypothetical protein
MKKMIFLFIIIFFVFIPNALAQTYTTKYLGTTAISGLGGTYWNLTDTTGTANTATSVKNAKTAANFYFKPGTSGSTSTGNPDSGIPVGFGWGTSYALAGTIPAGTWTFQVKTTSSSATGTGYMGVVVYKNCSGTSTRLFGIFNNTFNVLSSTSALITVITTSQPSFDVNGCYLKAEYWLNVTKAGTSSTATVTFTVNEASEFIQFPTPAVTTQTYERSITSNVGLSGLFAKTNNFERTSPLSLGFSSSFFKLSEFERFIASGIGLSNVFSKVINYIRTSYLPISLTSNFEKTMNMERLVGISAGIEGIFERMANYGRTTSSSIGITSLFARTSIFSRFTTIGIGLSGMFERITMFQQIFERVFSTGIGFLWNVIKLPIGEDIILEDRYAPAIGAIVVLLISLAYIMLI